MLHAKSFGPREKAEKKKPVLPWGPEWANTQGARSGWSRRRGSPKWNRGNPEKNKDFEKCCVSQVHPNGSKSRRKFEM